MAEFVDVYLPAKVPGLPCLGAPRFKTTIQVDAGGGERSNQEWEHPLHRFVLPEAVARDWEVVQQLKKHWLITRGPHKHFPWRDPLDFASCDLVRPNQVPTVAMSDQLVGTADGFTDRFQLLKTYSIGGETYDRVIHLPVVDSVLVALDGLLVDEAEYTVTRPGGEIVFNAPPTPEVGNPGIITAGFLFDVEVRFENDEAFEGILRATRAAGFADLTLIEVRPC